MVVVVVEEELAVVAAARRLLVRAEDVLVLVEAARVLLHRHAHHREHLVEVGLDALLHAGELHLDRDRLVVAERRRVHLQTARRK